MNKEQEELLDEAYKSYENYCQSLDVKDYDEKDTFIRGVKENKEYSNRWGLKIEERELSYFERCDIFQSTERFKMEDREHIKELNIEIIDKAKIPSKLITITYKDKTIESYEN